ncbi:hypothetical protein AOQ84DRAFT_226776 [Glonium stellatum]|uniref:C2H2-type domain-containing protein n=1 Tax=Glonium stellatum TaxID=574774 RepID=A0A8E2JX34_9PEZI|nr:hypothetical protein AOQ84DRAFT_226776 [Glonium stellatum]
MHSERYSQISSSISSDSVVSDSWDRSASSDYGGGLPFPVNSSQSSQSSSWSARDNQNQNYSPSSLKVVVEAPLNNAGLATPATHGHLNGNPSSSSLPVPAASDFCVCPFCAELDINGGAKRPSDLRRHLKKFHNTNAGWVCPIMGCELVFDWPAAYETHMKEAHAGLHLPATEVMVQLHTQVVFACGFVQCKKIFETPNDGDATPIAKNYFDHVARHIKEGASISDWSYTTRIHNLLRQQPVEWPWKEATSKEVRKRLIWQPHNSSVLRRKLECRVIGNVQTFMQIAVVLGSPPYSEPNSPQFVYPGFTSPTLDGMVSAWQTQSGSTPLSPNMNSMHAASYPLPSSIAATPVHGNPTHPSISQGQYPAISLPHASGWNSSCTGLHATSSPQTTGQPHVAQHVQAATAVPLLGYDAYNSGQRDNMLSMPQHPLGQWSGSDSLGRWPSQDEVIADITNRTPGQRLLLKAKRSIETFRGRKFSTMQGNGNDMSVNTPPMPTGLPTRYNATG